MVVGGFDEIGADEFLELERDVAEHPSESFGFHSLGGGVIRLMSLALSI